jgi:hypothetical protein
LIENPQLRPIFNRQSKIINQQCLVSHGLSIVPVIAGAKPGAGLRIDRDALRIAPIGGLPVLA